MAARLSKSTDASGVVVSLGCAYLLAIIAFWVVVVVVALHFAAKFW